MRNTVFDEAVAALSAEQRTKAADGEASRKLAVCRGLARDPGFERIVFAKSSGCMKQGALFRAIYTSPFVQSDETSGNDRAVEIASVSRLSAGSR